MVTGPPSFSRGEDIEREAGEGPSTCSSPGMHINKLEKTRNTDDGSCGGVEALASSQRHPAATVIPYRSATTALLSHTHPIDPSPSHVLSLHCSHHSAPLE